jgi:hypothetical protein
MGFGASTSIGAPPVLIVHKRILTIALHPSSLYKKMQLEISKEIRRKLS